MIALVLRLLARPGLRGWATVVLASLVAAGCVVRVREAYWHNPMDELFSDPLRHWTYAKETLSTQPWAFIDPPLFQMWLSVLQKWTLGRPPLVAAYAAALSVVTPWLWYRFLRETLDSRLLALLGWAALAWLPSWITIFRYFMTETLFLTLMGASLWQTMRAHRKRTLPAFAGMVALWTLTGLTRGIALPMAGVCGFFVWLQQGGKLKKAALSVAVVAPLLVPIAVRNHHQLGLWSPFGTGWPNQIYCASGAHDMHVRMTNDGGTAYYEFGSPSLYSKQLAPLSDWEPHRAGVVTVTADLRKGTEDWAAEAAANVRGGWEGIRLRLENVILVMLGESWPDKNGDCRFARAGLAMRFVWAPLLVLCAVAVAVRHREMRRRPLVPLLVAVWFAAQGPTLLAVNEGRYRKPVEGLLIALVLVLFDARGPRRVRVGQVDATREVAS